MLRRWISRAVGLSQQSPNIPNLPEIMSSEVLTSGRSRRRLRSVRPGAGSNNPPCSGYGCERSPENAPMDFGSGAGARAGTWNGCAKHRARG